MAYNTQVFVYTQRQIVVLLSGFSARAYMPQYSKPLTLNKGVDNIIQFQFLNQEQRPVDVTGKTIVCRILNYEGNELLIQKALTLQLPVTGICALILNATDIENITPQKAHYTLQIPVGEFDYPVFVDQNAGARGDINIVDSILPSFVPSQPVSIPTSQLFPNISHSSNANSNAITYFSSVIDTQANPVISIQAQYIDYVGDTIIEGSTITNGDWYPISTHSYNAASETQGYVIKGFHPYIRMKFVSNTGSVTNILSR